MIGFHHVVTIRNKGVWGFSLMTPWLVISWGVFVFSYCAFLFG